MSTGLRAVATGAFAVAATALLPAASVSAQAPDADPRWQAWLGCWQPVDTPAAAAAAAPSASAAGQLVCVTPAAGGSAVDVVSVADGKVTARERVDATAQRHETTKDGCAGWESAEWSARGARVYLRSEYVCPGGVQRKSSGLLAVSPDGEWLDVHSVAAGASTGVRVVRYREASASAELPAELSAALQGRALAVSTARAAAAAPLATGDVVEAVRHVEVPVVEAWLAERGQGFAVDGKRLVELADAGVPGRVIDMMVALSYPRVFAVDPASRQGELRTTVDSGRRAQGYATEGRLGPVVFVDRYGYSPYGWSAYSPYGGYLYGYGRGYGWYPGGGPVIVIRDPNGGGQPARRGRAVNGRGYTRGDGASGTGEEAVPRASTRERQSEGSSNRATRQSGGSSGSGPTRTAKPRP
jgi:hypothetical protein